MTEKEDDIEIVYGDAELEKMTIEDLKMLLGAGIKGNMWKRTMMILMKKKQRERRKPGGQYF